MTLRERIQKLCKTNGTSLNQVETELGFGRGYLSKLDSSTPNTKKMEQVANRFGVTIDFLMGKTDTITCKECDMCYNPLDDESVKEHEKIHNRYIDALRKFGFCYSMEESAEASISAINALSGSGLGNMSTKDLKDCYEKYLKADFSYFLRKQHFNVKFESFKEYAQNKFLKDLHEGFMTHDLVLSLADEFEVELSYVEGSEQLLARASENQQIMRILKYVEMLSQDTLNAIEIQLKALAEQNPEE